MGWRDCWVDWTLSIAALHANVCIVGSTKHRPLAIPFGLVGANIVGLASKKGNRCLP